MSPVRPRAFLRAMEIADPMRWPGINQRDLCRIRLMLMRRRWRAHDLGIARHRKARELLGQPPMPAATYHGGHRDDGGRYIRGCAPGWG